MVFFVARARTPLYVGVQSKVQRTLSLPNEIAVP